MRARQRTCIRITKSLSASGWQKQRLNRTYGQLNVVWREPQYQHLEVSGKKAIIHFEPGTTTGGLQTADGSTPRFFIIAGADQ